MKFNRRTFRKRLRKAWRLIRWFGLLLLTPLVMLLLPIIIPLSVMSYRAEQRRLGTFASRFRCLVCGDIIGASAVYLAGDFRAEQMEKWREENPGVRLDVEHLVDAICPRCEQHYRFCKEEYSFILLEDGE